MVYQTSTKQCFQRSQVMVTKNKKLINDIVRVNVLEEEINYAKSCLREHDTGHIHTAISWLQQRLEETKNGR